jgi:hypothetical protein
VDGGKGQFGLADGIDVAEQIALGRDARAVMAILRRRLVPLRIIEPWLARITAAATARVPTGEDPFLTTGNPEAFLRALHLQIALAPEPIGVRADLLLAVMDALRTTNTPYLGAPA